MTQSEHRPAFAPNGKHQKRDPKREDSLASFVFGKVQPQAVQLEEAVLGALMLDREALAIIEDILRPESFYLESHQHIYRAISRLYERQDPVDLLTVTEELKKTGELETAGGGHYLVELSNRVASAANIEYHSRIIAQKHIQRELIRTSTLIIRDAYEDTTDVFDLRERAEREILSIGHSKGGAARDCRDLAHEFFVDLEYRSNAPGGIVGIPTGIRSLDNALGGWRETDLVILAARPGMGKTAAAVGFALAAAERGYPVGIFSLEMSASQMFQRMVSVKGEIDGSHIRNAKMTDEDWQNAQSAAEKINGVFVDDTPAIALHELRSKARRMVSKQGVKMIFVDYLQLVTVADSRGGNREQEIAAISRGLKALAKELRIPVVALSQLSRAVEIRGGDKRPRLGDLRESGAIEQDADIVAFLYRPEYYEILTDEQGNNLKGIAEFIIAKHRHGALGIRLARFDERYTRFSTLPDGLVPDSELPWLDVRRPRQSRDWTEAEKEDIPF